MTAPLVCGFPEGIFCIEKLVSPCLVFDAGQLFHFIVCRVVEDGNRASHSDHSKNRADADAYQRPGESEA